MNSVHCCAIISHAQRLDTFIMCIVDFLPHALNTLSRSQLKYRVTHAYVNSQPAKLSHKVKSRDELMIFFNAYSTLETQYTLTHTHTSPHTWDITQAILHEDDKLILVNKPRGLVVHPGVGHTHNTLAHYIYAYLNYSHDEELVRNRVGIVHRLDKDTTGVMVVAKNVHIHERIAAQFSERKVHKQYIAIVHKTPQSLQGTVETNIVRNPFQRKKFMVTHHTDKGKHAITQYSVLYTHKEFSVVLCVPKTGRTHQIRVHMQYLGTPIVGDAIYSRGRHAYTTDTPLMLHAHAITFTLNDKKWCKEYHGTAPIPEEMKTMMDYIGMPDEILSQL